MVVLTKSDREQAEALVVVVQRLDTHLVVLLDQPRPLDKAITAVLVFCQHLLRVVVAVVQEKQETPMGKVLVAMVCHQVSPARQ